jgi:hypothetical protein
MNGDMCAIEYKGRVHTFVRPSGMSNKMFMDRSWYVVKNMGVEHVESFADLWIAHRYYGVGYGKEITVRMMELASNAVSTC